MLWDEFINSYWRDWRTGDTSKDRDRLEDEEWLRTWLESQSLTSALLPDTEELKQLKQLRTFLFAQVQTIVHGEAPGEESLRALNSYMANGAVIRQLLRDTDGRMHLNLQPLGSAWPEIMAEIAASFAGALADKESSRFRICDNPDCLWVYYDDTRNRSKRYCDDKACGNLLKVRRFRARKKAGDGDAGSSTEFH